jgi:hypothetical protein
MAPEDIGESSTSAAEPDAVTLLESRYERLRDTVETLRTQMEEKKKPWYKQPTILMSIAGTLFAVGSGLYNIHISGTQNVLKNVADLHSIVSDLIQLRADDIQDSSSAKADFASYYTRSTFRQTKRLALLEDAAFKIKSASNRVSPSILLVLANEVDQNGDYKTTYKYLLLAKDRSEEQSPERVGAYFTLAQFCYTDGKSLCKTNEGKQAYEAALAEQPADSDSMHFQKGQLYARVGVLLRQAAHDNASAQSNFALADTEATKIAPENGMRQALVQVIATARATPGGTSNSNAPPSFTDPSSFLGRWRIHPADAAQHSGTITFVPLSAPSTYGAFLDLSQNNILLEKQQGQVLVVNPQSLRMDWSSLAPTGQSAGYSLFTFSTSGKKLILKQFRFGESPLTFRLERIQDAPASALPVSGEKTVATATHP